MFFSFIMAYNSSRFVIETLKNFYRQLYIDIELIVSDDCLNDNAISL